MSSKESQDILAHAFLANVNSTCIGTLIKMQKAIQKCLSDKQEMCPTIVLNSWKNKDKTNRSLKYDFEFCDGWKCTLTIKDESFEMCYTSIMSEEEMKSIAQNSSKERPEFKKMVKKRVSRLATSEHPERFCIC